MATSGGIYELRLGRKVWLAHTRKADPALRVLLVHGSAASMAQYSAQVARLVARGDASVLAWDWLGCGRSEKPREWSAYSPHELRADVEAALALLCADGKKRARTLIVAHSYGCSLVAELLAAKPELQPSGLVVLSTSDGSALMSQLGIFWLPVMLLTALQPTLTSGFVAAAFHPDADEAVVESGRAVSAANDMFMCKAFYRQMRWATPDMAAAVLCPVLAVHGLNDQIIPVLRGREWLARFAGPRAFVEVPGASHMVMMERAEVINGILDQVADNVVAGRPALRGL